MQGQKPFPNDRMTAKLEEAPTSVLDAWCLYEQEVHKTYESSKASAILAQGKSALFRYTLPGFDFPSPKGKGITVREAKEARMFMSHLPKEQLAKAAIAQQQVFDSLQTRKQTQRTYRHALYRFLEWCNEQSWCTWSFEKRSLPRGRQKQELTPSPRITERRRTDAKGKKLYIYEYGLEQVANEQIPEQLQQELDAFYQFRTEANTAHGFQKVKKVTANKELEQIRLLLGWMHLVKQQPLDNLNLQQLLPLISSFPKTNTEKTVQQKKHPHLGLTLMHEYLHWLQEKPASLEENAHLPPRSQSPHTRTQIISLFLVISKFISWKAMHQISEEQYEKLDVVQALKFELNQSQQQLSPQASVNLSTQKLLGREQFQELVELLRQECLPQKEYSTHTGRNKTRQVMRSLSAIAFSYQRFLLVALMNYLPPRRPYYYWALLVQQPASQEQEQPNIESLEFSGFLSRKEGKWLIHWKRDGPQGKSAPLETLEIPNPAYEDGRHFYDYIQEWLTSFAYQEHTLPGLRSVFQPDHDFFFTKRTGQAYTRANDFKHLLRTPAYRQTGKSPTPITIRLLFKDKE